jgi:hypothetical protein
VVRAVSTSSIVGSVIVSSEGWQSAPVDPAARKAGVDSGIIPPNQ